MGDPLERDPDQVLADVLDRMVSIDAARSAYGVVLSPEGTAVDHDATKECREALRRARGPVDWIYDRGDRGGEHGREP